MGSVLGINVGMEQTLTLKPHTALGDPMQLANESTQSRHQKHMVVNSRDIAIGLVTVASCYLIVMICRAYHRMNMQRGKGLRSDGEDSSHLEGESITYYYYDTESYDFQQYQSIEGQDQQINQKGVQRGFEYNQSIGSNTNSLNGDQDQIPSYR